mgnify:CR=1 FL=1
MRPPLAAPSHARTGSQPQHPDEAFLLTEEELFPPNELNFIKKKPFHYASFKNPQPHMLQDSVESLRAHDQGPHDYPPLHSSA